MRIRKDGRIEPFSHRPGVRLLLPGSHLECQVYPTRVVIGECDWRLPIEGPVAGFTVQLDLEGGSVRVWGIAKSGPFRYRLRAGESDPTQFRMVVEKGELPVPDGSPISLFVPPKRMERLSLGSHKSQEWEAAVCRGDMAELFPAWLRLGQLLPPCETAPFPGSLLEKCREGRELDPFVHLFYAGFSDLLLPRLFDADWRGFSLSPLGEGYRGSALPLLSEGARTIRSLFIDERGEELALLPRLPFRLHAGRFLDLEWRLGRLDMEWSRRRLRRLILRGEAAGSFDLKSADWRQCRLSSPSDLRGRLLLSGDPVSVGKGEILYLDRFEK